MSVDTATYFFYTNQGGQIKIQTIDDEAELAATEAAFKTLGAGDDRSLASIYAVIAALLHMGNMVFEATDTPDTSRVKVCCAETFQ